MFSPSFSFHAEATHSGGVVSDLKWVSVILFMLVPSRNMLLTAIVVITPAAHGASVTCAASLVEVTSDWPQRAFLVVGSLVGFLCDRPFAFVVAGIPNVFVASGCFHACC